MIEFEALTIKADTDELHAIFLLKKNIQQDIIKTILGYLPIAALEMLKKWKVAITSVSQGYESMKGRNDYKTSTGITYGGRRQPMDIRKSNKNFKDGKLKCFNCNKYRHMVSGMVHTGVEVRRMDSEMSGLVERPWLQLMCCAVCLLHGHNFR